MGILSDAVRRGGASSGMGCRPVITAARSVQQQVTRPISKAQKPLFARKVGELGRQKVVASKAKPVARKPASKNVIKSTSKARKPLFTGKVGELGRQKVVASKAKPVARNPASKKVIKFISKANQPPIARQKFASKAKPVAQKLVSKVIKSFSRVEEPRTARKVGESGCQQVASKATPKLPASLQAHLDSWGPHLARKLQAAKQQWFRQHLPGVGVPVCLLFAVKVGTDCSGAEAPIWALKAMNVRHEHVFSCDWKACVRTFIKATCPPTGPIFTDMLTRSCADIPDMDVYVCGFPCTPFSHLRQHDTRLLKEAAAKPFFKVLEVLRERKPRLAVLENVLGIRKVITKVLKYLEKLEIFTIIVLPIDSQDLGEPLARPRYYFILVRRDVGVLSDTNKIKSLVAAMAHAAHEPMRTHIASRLFSNESPLVQNYLKKLAKRHGVEESGSSGKSRTRKWEAQHQAFRTKKGLNRRTTLARVEASGGLTSARMRDALALWRQVVGSDLTGDFSQSLERIHPRTDGVSPTLTPNGVVYVGGRNVDRVVTPFEKLVAHLFPVHRMQIPEDFPEEKLGHLGGNTMHLKSVGLALTIGLGLVDWSASQSLSGLGKAPSAIQLPLNTVRSGL